MRDNRLEWSGRGVENGRERLAQKGTENFAVFTEVYCI